MKNKIIFIPSNKNAELTIPAPKPAKLYIPEWYKNIPAINEKNIKVDNNGVPNVNTKNCIPFLDVLTSGYIQETWTDIHIDTDEDGYVIYNQSSMTSLSIMGDRDKKDLPISQYFYDFEFVWHQFWMPKLPDGYSCLYVSPLNRVDLPFYTTSGIIDNDKLVYNSGGNIPFYIKKGFKGIIPAGTPMYQMIPFKRDSWKSDFEEYNDEKAYSGSTYLRKNFIASYKKRMWSKKDFS